MQSIRKFFNTNAANSQCNVNAENIVQTVCDKVRVLPYFKNKNFQLRRWQSSGLVKVAERAIKLTRGEPCRDNFFTAAVMASGKTWFGILSFLVFRELGLVDRLILLCPTSNLKKDWAEDAEKLGISLQYVHEGTHLSSDYSGRAMTYQGLLTRSPRRIGALKGDVDHHKVFLIIDEAHHVVLQNEWGKKVVEYYSNSVFKMLMSGTPMRTVKGEVIPFTEHKVDGNSTKYTFDISTTYGEGITEGTHAQVFFEFIDGRMKWAEGDEVFEHTFKDVIAPRQQANRLRTGITLNGDSISIDEGDSTEIVIGTQMAKGLLKKAVRHLRKLRIKFRVSQGLIVAKDQAHAREIVEYLQELGENPRLAISDEGDCNDLIKNFRDNPTNDNNCWIVSVRKIYEGCNIQNLAIEVYLSNVVAPIYLLQAFHRVTRITDYTDRCYIYVPKDKRIEKVAKTLLKDSESQVPKAFPSISEGQSNIASNQQSLSDDEDSDNSTELIPLDSVPKEFRQVQAISTSLESAVVFSVVDNKQYNDLAALDYAKHLVEQGKFNTIDEAYAAIPKVVCPQNFDDNPQAPAIIPMQERVKEKRTKINQFINEKIGILKARRITNQPYDHIVKIVYGMSYKSFGKHPMSEFSLGELDAFMKHVQRVFGTISRPGWWAEREGSVKRIRARKRY